jgi:hypothetical protein
LCLEIATGGGIDERAWIDPEVQQLAGISNDDLHRYLAPPAYERPAAPVRQPQPDSAKPNLDYPPAVYARIVATPDEAFWNSVENQPPGKVS